ncbi:MAG: hypothetical protein MI725_11445 [Pirellulales bacterium]|nr:hypothetical protein [Pirellulales bacterium]
MMELTALWLPTLLSAVALFFIGFMTWMLLPVHKADWRGLPDEDAFGDAVRNLNIPAGNYMFPYCANAEDMKSEAFLEKQKRGPTGTMQIWDGPAHMGKNLVCQFLYLLVTSFCIAYLAKQGLQAGAGFMDVFQFVGTAGILIYTAAHVPATIWFKSRLTGHIVDGLLCGLATGLIFAALWPGATPAS